MNPLAWLRRLFVTDCHAPDGPAPMLKAVQPGKVLNIAVNPATGRIEGYTVEDDKP